MENGLYILAIQVGTHESFPAHVTLLKDPKIHDEIARRRVIKTKQILILL